MAQSIDLIREFLAAVVEWASAQADVTAVALVGSYARDAAKSTSDIDLVILTHCPARYLGDTAWAGRFGNVQDEQVEDWGKVTSLRVWYEGGREVEFGFATPQWAEPPVDEGTRRVIADGLRVLLDREGMLGLALGG